MIFVFSFQIYLSITPFAATSKRFGQRTWVTTTVSSPNALYTWTTTSHLSYNWSMSRASNFGHVIVVWILNAIHHKSYMQPKFQFRLCSIKIKKRIVQNNNKRTDQFGSVCSFETNRLVNIVWENSIIIIENFFFLYI